MPPVISSCQRKRSVSGLLDSSKSNKLTSDASLFFCYLSFQFSDLLSFSFFLTICAGEHSHGISEIFMRSHSEYVWIRLTRFDKCICMYLPAFAWCW